MIDFKEFAYKFDRNLKVTLSDDLFGALVQRFVRKKM